jgi:hypothetical protein
MRKKGTSEISIICIYVDDCLHIYKGEGIRKELYSRLADAKLEGLKIDQLSTLNSITFLGLMIRKFQDQSIFINQIGYLNTLLEQYGPYPRQTMSPCKDDAFNPKDEAEDLQEPIRYGPYCSNSVLRYPI